MFYRITNSIKPTTITRRRGLEEVTTTTTTEASNDKVANNNKMKVTTHHYPLHKWKIGATVVVAPGTRVRSVRRGTAFHVPNGRLIRLPSYEECSRCSNRCERQHQYLDQNRHLLQHQPAPVHQQLENHWQMCSPGSDSHKLT